MDATAYIAKVAALLYICVGAGALLNKGYLKKLLDDYIKSPSAEFTGAIIAMVAGAVLLYIHSDWTWNWKILITIIGWVGLIKGAVLFVLPGQMMKLAERILKIKGLYTFTGVMCLVLGLLFGYYGFMM